MELMVDKSRNVSGNNHNGEKTVITAPKSSLLILCSTRNPRPFTSVFSALPLRVFVYILHVSGLSYKDGFNLSATGNELLECGRSKESLSCYQAIVGKVTGTMLPRFWLPIKEKEYQIQHGPNMLVELNNKNKRFSAARREIQDRYRNIKIDSSVVASQSEKQAFKKYCADQSVTQKEFFSETALGACLDLDMPIDDQEIHQILLKTGPLGRALTNPWMQYKVDSGAVSMDELKEKSAAVLNMLSLTWTTNHFKTGTFTQEEIEKASPELLAALYTDEGRKFIDQNLNKLTNKIYFPRGFLAVSDLMELVPVEISSSSYSIFNLSSVGGSQSSYSGLSRVGDNRSSYQLKVRPDALDLFAISIDSTDEGNALFQAWAKNHIDEGNFTQKEIDDASLTLLAALYTREGRDFIDRNMGKLRETIHFPRGFLAMPDLMKLVLVPKSTFGNVMSNFSSVSDDQPSYQLEVHPAVDELFKRYLLQKAPNRK